MSTPSILYNNIYDGTQTATTTATGFDIANVSDLRPYTLWKGTGTANQFITIDAGTARSANSLGIIGHDLFAQNATISVEYSTNNSAWNVAGTYVSGVDFLSDKLIYKEFPIQTARYWRLKIATGYTVVPFIGALFIGSRLSFPQGVKRGFDPTPYKIISQNQVSKNGQLLGSAISMKQLELNLLWDKLDASFVDGDFSTFWYSHASLLKPFFWIWNFSLKPSEVYFIWVNSNTVKRFPYSVGTSHKNVSFRCKGVLE